MAMTYTELADWAIRHRTARDLFAEADEIVAQVDPDGPRDEAVAEIRVALVKMKAANGILRRLFEETENDGLG